MAKAKEIDPHPLAGKYDIDGTLKLGNKVFAFKGATIAKASSGPSAEGFTNIVIRAMVNNRAMKDLMQWQQDAAAELEEVAA